MAVDRFGRSIAGTDSKGFLVVLNIGKSLIQKQKNWLQLYLGACPPLQLLIGCDMQTPKHMSSGAVFYMHNALLYPVFGARLNGFQILDEPTDRHRFFPSL